MHALVTGASSGIGAATARAFAQVGYNLTLLARRAAELDQLAAECRGVKVTPMPADLSQLDRLPEWVEAAQRRLGPIDVLVNNAGREIVDAFAEVPLAEADNLFALNLMAPLRLIRLVLPSMVERQTGTIVNVASVAAFVHPPYQTYYSASKAALSAASVSLRNEVRRHGVQVLAVYPGPVHTAMGEDAAQRTTAPAGLVPWGRAEVLGKRIVRAVGRRQQTLVYPRLYWVAKIFPGVARRLMELFPAELR